MRTEIKNTINKREPIYIFNCEKKNLKASTKVPQTHPKADENLNTSKK